MRPAPITLAAALLLGAAAPCERAVPASGRPQDQARVLAARIELPAGPAAEALARVAADAEPVPLPAELAPGGRLAGPLPWSRPQTWELWAEWLAEITPETSVPLALLAAQQGRHADAWTHFASAAEEPGRAARVLPCLLPGAPLSAAAVAGGAPGPLPDGVLLKPVLPTVGAKDGSGAPRSWTATVHDVRVGEAVIDLRLVVDESGVQVDLVHVGGGAATVRLLIPEPEGWQIRIEYVDWFRQDTLREPFLLELEPGGEPRVLFGRCLPREVPWPAGASGGLPEGLQRGGLRLVVPEGDPELELLLAAGQAIGRAVGVRTSVVTVAQVDAPAPVTDDTFGATDVRLPAGPERARKLAWLVSSIERHRLRER